ncbi:Poly [ADP-ribose] polymerase 2-A [Orchesella cincta]|uniref:Poly [ADP-ribose] polymerase n=1 Tax=Orchesella cincta TaxID=48709 RepID=A0A1D2MNV1_ORCCI|nr:Poly [ADP-ribose] polymerase 2-A [Orchesella cincta]
MGCCFSCFGICKSNPSTDFRSRYGATTNVGTTHSYSRYSNPYSSVPSSPNVSYTQHTLSAKPRTTSPQLNYYGASTTSRTFGNLPTAGSSTPLLKPKVEAPKPNSAYQLPQTSKGTSQLNYQTFSVRPAQVPIARQVSKTVPTTPKTLVNAVGRQTHHSNKTVPTTQKTFVNAVGKQTHHANKTVELEKVRDNFDAIPLLCRILDSTPQHMKARLNVAQFFSKKHWEYPVILEYINNSQAHSNFGIKVVSIIKICQRHVTEFRNRPGFNPTAHRMMLWHGSKFSNVRSILEHGLKLPEPDTAAHSQPLFGNGIYFADRVTKSAFYCNSTPTGSGCLFLCDVMLGNEYPSRNTLYGATGPPTGYDSVKGVGKFVPGPSRSSLLRKGNLYGSNMPLGKTVENPDPSQLRYSINYNEFVVYDPDCVNIKYLVYFQFTDKPFVNCVEDVM